MIAIYWCSISEATQYAAMNYMDHMNQHVYLIKKLSFFEKMKLKRIVCGKLDSITAIVSSMLVRYFLSIGGCPGLDDNIIKILG